MKGKSFDELKVKYKATENTETSTDSHLYKLLKKIDGGSQLGDPDIKVLKKLDGDAEDCFARKAVCKTKS
ncbi:MAG: hypothetical protein EBE86_014125 [Hormoscilla sp. GUM202]|nr:hypothetical protein [Hormoscilla sp. GUM202]